MSYEEVVSFADMHMDTHTKAELYMLTRITHGDKEEFIRDW